MNKSKSTTKPGEKRQRRFRGHFVSDAELDRAGGGSRSHRDRQVAAGRHPPPVFLGSSRVRRFKAKEMEDYYDLIEAGGEWRGPPSKNAPPWAVREYEQHKAERKQRAA
jgi:predicted DNA-binding transcriptional regulator AlpA